MDIIAQIVMYLLMIFQAFQFLFPSTPVPPVPEEPTSEIVQETTTEAVPEEPSTEAPTTQCSHSGGKATCQKKAKCALCGEEYGEFGKHDYSTYTQKPTCTAEGKTYYTCKDCGQSYSDSEVPALGHSYKGVTTDATCTMGAFITYTCESCGDTYVENKSGPTGHSYSEVETLPTCLAGGYTEYTCEDCGDSYRDNEVPALGHSFTDYSSDGNATCSQDGTKTASCNNGCGETETVTDTGSILPHVDENKDTLCDNGGEKLHIEFTHLTYPEGAVKRAEDWGLTVEEFVSRADAYEQDVKYTANQGYTDTNGIIISPYYTAEIDGVDVPVYGTTVYVGETGKGALHSFSEIYVEKGEYCTFEIKINSGSLGIANAVVLPEAYGETVTVKDGIATAVLSGYGAHTFLFNDENQAYAYTVFVREEIDDAAEIAKLQADGYTVYVVEGFLENHTYTVFSGGSTSKSVIYLKKGAYVTAKHIFDINSDDDNNSIVETAEDGKPVTAHNGMGLNRLPFVSAYDNSDIKILGYGVLDLTHLDRGERRGLVFTFTNNVEVRGVKLINAPEWTFITYRCDTVKIKDVDVFGYRLNSDAFDICNSKNVTIEGCFARSGDDIFGVKALGGDENAITENIVMTNCYAWAGKARAFGIFGECNRPISDVTFKDSFVLMHDADWDYDRIPALGIVVETVDANNGAITFDNIRFENIDIHRNDAAAMNCLIFGGVKNFTLSNITFKDISYSSNAVLNRIVNYGGEGSNNTISVTFENNTCNGTSVVDGNKTLYFSEESYWGGYITVK